MAALALASLVVVVRPLASRPPKGTRAAASRDVMHKSAQERMRRDNRVAGAAPKPARAQALGPPLAKVKRAAVCADRQPSQRV